jgi:undecaprenyl diphosphate synthase
MKDKIQHIAIIMDGNGRWAKSQGKSRVEGHVAGVDALKRTVESAVSMEINHLTVYALSRDNMKRPGNEVKALLQLFLEHIPSYLPKLIEQGIVIKFIGDIYGLPSALQQQIKQAEAETKNGQCMVLTIALNYSAKWHIAQTLESLSKTGRAVTVSAIEDHLDAQLPSEPDLLIRTGGEQRLSDFLLYHLAYTELMFIQTYWPDFNATLLKDCMTQYMCRERRFGQIEAGHVEV